jgi:hypothetical protein
MVKSMMEETLKNENVIPFPPRENLVIDIPIGDGNVAHLFYSVSRGTYVSLHAFTTNYLTGGREKKSRSGRPKRHRHKQYVALCRCQLMEAGVDSFPTR